MKTYDPNTLFQPGIDEIHYKESNSVHTMEYNASGEHGVLDVSRETPFIRFPLLDQIPFIRHGFSTRLGGVSEEYFSTLNLSFVRGDDTSRVIENYERIMNAMGMGEQYPIFSGQVHDVLIHKVTKDDLKTTNGYENKFDGIDGLITDVPGVALITSYADCVPLYIIDPVKKSIGLSHSGWKGTVGKIGKKTVESMMAEYGSNPEDLLAVVGPSICFDCYEISENVANEFMDNFSNDIINKILYDKGKGKYQLDLWLTNKYILMEAGIKEENIMISNICTNCNSNLLFSHRASGGNRGNLAAFLSLVDEIQE